MVIVIDIEMFLNFEINNVVLYYKRGFSKVFLIPHEL